MSRLRVLHYSTHNEDCGIGKYQEQFIQAMTKVGAKDVYNEFFPYSPNVTKVMTYDEFTSVLQELRGKLDRFDILHIQHELSFYKHDELGRIVKAAHEAGKQVIFTVHTAPDAQYKRPRRHGYGLHSTLGYLRDIKAANEFTRIHIEPMKHADLILVHNTATKINLVQHGIASDKISLIRLPVPVIDSGAPIDEIHKSLKYQEGDVIIGAVGFISRTKGVGSAIRALNLLPSNYKLALIGGVHPSGAGEDYLEEITDFFIKRGLKERVYITGYIEDDVRLNSLIRECDLCVYPYDRTYYKYASSAALNNAFANHKPAIAYPTESFVEMNTPETIAICKSANYYELARYIIEADYDKLTKASKSYATTFSYPNEAKKLIAIYKGLLS